jgi:hypothetical protein
MGIKFLCPNGHKLNVKSFLSGKRAICPKCGARVLVPNESQLAPDSSESSAAGGESTMEVALASSSTVGHSTANVAAAGALPTGGPASVAAPSDVIAQAPTAVWYVRPATGGQFGPASGDIMRAWIEEGRVGASSLVWRNGWPEWRSAAAVFPQLRPLGDSVTPGATETAGASRGVSSLLQGALVQNISAGQPSDSPRGISTGIPPLAQTVRKRRLQNDRRLIFSAAMVVVAIILGILLVMVFRRQGQPEESPAQEASPPAEVTAE